MKATVNDVVKAFGGKWPDNAQSFDIHVLQCIHVSKGMRCRVGDLFATSALWNDYSKMHWVYVCSKKDFMLEVADQVAGNKVIKTMKEGAK